MDSTQAMRVLLLDCKGLLKALCFCFWGLIRFIEFALAFEAARPSDLLRKSASRASKPSSKGRVFMGSSVHACFLQPFLQAASTPEARRPAPISIVHSKCKMLCARPLRPLDMCLATVWVLLATVSTPQTPLEGLHGPHLSQAPPLELCIEALGLWAFRMQGIEKVSGLEVLFSPYVDG